MAHPARRRVLSALGKGESTADQLRAGLSLSQPAMSQHLRVLRETGLVRQRVQGRQRLYRINTSTLNKIRRWIGQMG